MIRVLPAANHRWSEDHKEHLYIFGKLALQMDTMLEIGFVIVGTARKDELLRIWEGVLENGNLLHTQPQRYVAGIRHFKSMPKQANPVTSVAEWTPLNCAA